MDAFMEIPIDGKSPLFAALEYGDAGLVFTEGRNCMSAAEVQTRRHGILLAEREGLAVG